MSVANLATIAVLVMSDVVSIQCELHVGNESVRLVVSFNVLAMQR